MSSKPTTHSDLVAKVRDYLRHRKIPYETQAPSMVKTPPMRTKPTNDFTTHTPIWLPSFDGDQYLIVQGKSILAARGPDALRIRSEMFAENEETTGA